MTTYTWIPSDEYLTNSRVSQFAREHGIANIDEFRTKSTADISWFWDAVVKNLDLSFSQPYTSVVDLSNGIEFPEWFVGGHLNVVDACLARWQQDPRMRDQPAVVHEAENGDIRQLTYAELYDQVVRASAGLKKLGLGKGDAIAMYLPMTPEAVVAFYAIARIGAIAVPLFSGFAAAAIASRLQDADVKCVFVADGTIRRKKSVLMRPILQGALSDCPTVKNVVVIDNIDSVGELHENEISWQELLENPGSDTDQADTLASDVLLLGYTSGTTGKPKGAVHTHAGFLVKTASEVAYSFDLGRGEVFCWITDMGWVMGPLSIVGTHANGGTLLLYEGSPDVPDLNRIWDLVARHHVTMLGVSPTLIRTLSGTSAHEHQQRDLSSVRILGSTGEPWDPDSYEWLAISVFNSRVPIINFSGGTEVGGSFLAPYPVEHIRSCSLGGPSLGMDVDVVNDQGESIREEVGELICRQPWPAMTKGVWKDNDRYIESYWSTFPGVWRHGDYALIQDGQWFIRGRSDDVMNVAGKRLAPAEVESVVTGHPAVAESAAIGVPDSTKGEAVWVFWIPRDSEGGLDVSAELTTMVGDALGKPFAPSRVFKVTALPKTRSAKIMRRAIRAAALGLDPGDMSGAENPESLSVISEVVNSKS